MIRPTLEGPRNHGQKPSSVRQRGVPWQSPKIRPAPKARLWEDPVRRRKLPAKEACSRSSDNARRAAAQIHINGEKAETKLTSRTSRPHSPCLADLSAIKPFSPKGNKVGAANALKRRGENEEVIPESHTRGPMTSRRWGSGAAIQARA